MRLREQVRRWAVDGVDFIQLREKDLSAGELLGLARAAMEVLREHTEAEGSQRRPRLLINSRPDIALAAGADGVHLPTGPGALTTAQTRAMFAGAGRPRGLVSRSCHTLEEVEAACAGAVDFVLFGPIFEKRVRGEVVVEGKGLDLLRQACVTAGETPVLALGGITAAGVEACMEAGAAGFAGIRLFA